LKIGGVAGALTSGQGSHHIRRMSVTPFPASGLSHRDLHTLEAFCEARRLRGVPSYIVAGELEAERPGQRPMLYASIKDAPKGRTVFVVDRTENVYRVRYWHTAGRQMTLVARHRSLARVLRSVPDWPGTLFERSSS